MRALDTARDWQFGRGLQSYVSGMDAVKQSLATRLRSWLGDCFFALEDGIDYQNRLGRMSQRAPLESELAKMILSTDGVLSLEHLTTSFDDVHRRFSANYRVNTIYSDSMSDVLEVQL